LGAPGTHFAGFAAVFRKNGSPPFGFLIGVETFGSHFGIIVKLVSITTEKRFHGTEYHFHIGLIQVEVPVIAAFVHIIGSYIHRINESGFYLFREKRHLRIGIGQVWEEQPFQKGSHLAGGDP
jgi:hypothetical protein